MLRKLEKVAGTVPARLSVDSFVAPRLRAVYLCIPKTLSRSMLRYLASVDADGYRIHERHAGAEVLEADSVDGSPRCFAFVRNPYSRIVAVYYNKFVNYSGTPPQVAMFARSEHLRPDMTFAELVRWLASDEGSDEGADPHFLSQHYFLLDRDGNPAVDFVGRVEHADDDVAELQELLGLPAAPLPRANSNVTGHRVRFDTANRWHEVLDDRTTQMLTSRYEADLEFLGYPRLSYRAIPLAPGRANGRRRVVLPSRLRATADRIFDALGYEIRRRPARSGPAGSDDTHA